METSCRATPATISPKRVMAHWSFEDVYDWVESSLRHLREQVEDKDRLLFEKDVIIADKDLRLEEMSRCLGERDQFIAALKETVNELLRKLNTNSTNSGIPPSQDPFRARGSADKKPLEPEPEPKPGDKAGDTEATQEQDGNSDSKPASAENKKRKQGGQKGHPGHQQEMLQPDEVIEVHPEGCTCGCKDIIDQTAYHTRQQFDVQILIKVIHAILYEGRCANCGKMVKAQTPAEFSTGYGPTLTSFVGGLIAYTGCTRRQAKELLANSGFFRTKDGKDLPLSTGAVQSLIDRCSKALEPVHDIIGQIARLAPFNHIDETSWPMFGPKGVYKYWLWTMASPHVIYLSIHRHRSKEAFLEFIGDWYGFLISDDYALYRSWPPEMRQSCLAHLLRHARKLKEDPDPDIAGGGNDFYTEIDRLMEMQSGIRDEKAYKGWVMRVKRLINKYVKLSNRLGSFALRLDETFDSLSTFLRVPEVEPTNNRAERSLRAAVTRRKISFGSTSEKGMRWIERAYSVLMTCRLHKLSFFDVLREGVNHVLKGTPQRLFPFRRLKRHARWQRREMGLLVG